MKSQLFDLGAASIPIQPIPAQDILKVLRSRPWSYRTLLKEERELLKEADLFLELAIKGQSIIRQSTIDGSFTPDVVSLDAYEYTRRALESSLRSQYQTFVNIEQCINKVHDAIEAILQLSNPEEGKSHPNLEDEPRKFFETFIDYSYNHSLAIPQI